MSLSKTALCREEDLVLLFVVLATQQTALCQKQLQILRLQEELEALDEAITNAERRCRVLASACLCFCERHVWSYLWAQSWYEETLTHFPDSIVRKNFRLHRNMFHYIVSMCASMERQDTNVQKAIPLAKSIATALYRLAISAEDGTVANLFGISCSSMNIRRIS